MPAWIKKGASRHHGERGVGCAHLEDGGAGGKPLGDLGGEGQVLEGGVVVVEVQQVDEHRGAAGGSQGRPPACGGAGQGARSAPPARGRGPHEGSAPRGQAGCSVLNPVLLAARVGQRSANKGRGRVQVKRDPCSSKPAGDVQRASNEQRCCHPPPEIPYIFCSSEPETHVPGPKDHLALSLPSTPASSHSQSVTDTTILRISSASCGLGFSRSSSTPEVRILPLVLLRL